MVNLVKWVNDEAPDADFRRMELARRIGRAHLPRRGRQRGATLVEASIASMMFFTVLLGLFEFGWAFRDYLTTADVAQSAARVGSSSGNDVTADYGIVQQVRKGVTAMSAGQLLYFVVFDAGSSGANLSTLSPTCAAGTPVTGVCNVYVTADLARPATDYGCQTSLPSPDRFWCPSTRRINASVATGGPPNYLGVYVKTRHNSITRFLGSGVTFDDQAILRIEPEER
jgi:Flp pilus assembly protein TadG